MQLQPYFDNGMRIVVSEVSHFRVFNMSDSGLPTNIDLRLPSAAAAPNLYALCFMLAFGQNKYTQGETSVNLTGICS